MAVDRSFFRENPWLRNLSPSTVATLAAKAIVRRLAHGQLWVSHTERARGIAIIVEGGLRSTTFTADGKEYVFSIMKKGDIAGRGDRESAPDSQHFRRRCRSRTQPANTTQYAGGGNPPNLHGA